MENRELLRKQITEACANVLYTYIAHWIIVNRLIKKQNIIKISQIVLTAASTTGFLASIISGFPYLNWLGGLTAALALSLNLYTHEFTLAEDTKSHKDAANELWDVREAYKSLLVDFSVLKDEEIRKKRDKLISQIGQINKKYPGTDDKAYSKAKTLIERYEFDEDEADNLINLLIFRYDAKST